MNRKEFAIIAVITLFTVIMWVTFGVLHAKQSSTVTKVQLQQTIPLTPAFDQDTINQLSTREN